MHSQWTFPLALPPLLSVWAPVMPEFLKAIRLSLRYKWTLLASILCALLIGILWGASIGAVYPFVEVVLQGETVETWLDREAAGAATSLRETEQAIGNIEQQLGAATDDAKSALQAQLALKQARRFAEEQALLRLQGLRPWIKGRVPTTPFGTLAAVMGILVVATVLKGGLLVLNVVLVSRVADRTVLDMRRTFYRSALEMDQSRLDAIGTSEMITNFSHTVNLVGEGLKALYGKSIREPLRMWACLLTAAVISWQLLLLSLVLVPVGFYFMRKLAERMKQAALSEIGGVAGMLQTLLETLHGLKTVRIYNREQRERWRFKQMAAKLCRLNVRMSFYDAVVKPVTELTGIVTLVMAILVGAYLVLNQETHLFGIRLCSRPLSASGLFTFYAMLAGAADPARRMSDIYTILIRGVSASQSLFRLFEVQPSITAPKHVVPVPCHERSITFTDVCFGYKADQQVLHDLTLEIPYRQTVALVGENGCGKSTLMNLLPRFYDPQAGGIFIDGVNLRDMHPKQLRRQMGLVSQDPVLFRGSIRDNIRYGAPHASHEELLAAARLAQVDGFVQRLPAGYDTDVGDGGSFLSGGQRQRVALARAILANPRILILDEATSQIDRSGEQLLHEALKSFLCHRTSIIITHRLSTLDLVDRVIVMEHGRIIDDLTPSQFRQRRGTLSTDGKEAA